MYIMMDSVKTTDKRFKVEVRGTVLVTCLVGGTFSESSACKPVACQMPSHTKSCEGEFHYKEKTMCECLDGYRAGGTVGGAASFQGVLRRWICCGAGCFQARLLRRTDLRR